jgi:hypothetical protein
MANHTTQEEFASARELAARWGCKRDTVHARLQSAGVARLVFGPKSHRWRWEDVFAYEANVTVEASASAAQVTPSQDRTRSYGKKGPVGRRQRVTT